MTVAVYRRLWCDGVIDGAPCGAWVGTAELPGGTANGLRRLARIDGWRRVEGKDLCSDCLNIADSAGPASA